jgi:hypothetical protein
LEAARTSSPPLVGQHDAPGVRVHERHRALDQYVQEVQQVELVDEVSASSTNVSAMSDSRAVTMTPHLPSSCY